MDCFIEINNGTMEIGLRDARISTTNFTRNILYTIKITNKETILTFEVMSKM